MDVKKYFDTIDHLTLKHLLKKRIKDNEVLGLVDKIIESYQTSPGKGLPIGNLTSQHLANFYLNGLDHYIKETLGQKYYLRYMNDMVIFHTDMAELCAVADKIRNYIESELKLTLKYSKTRKNVKGVPFLGFTVKPGGLHLTRETKRRTEKKVMELTRLRHQVPEQEFTEKISAVHQHICFGRSYNFRYKLYTKAGLLSF